MRKSVCILYMCLLFLFNWVSHAETKSDFQAMDIATCYIKWLNVYHLDVNSDPFSSEVEGEDNKRIMFVDDLAVLYDNSNFIADLAVLFYIDEASKALDFIEQWQRAAALFGAIEYGNPDLIQGQNIVAVKRDLKHIVSTMNEMIYECAGLLESGNEFTFYRGNTAEYSIAYSKDDKQWSIYALIYNQ